MTLEKEIFPAATDSRFIRAVSICTDINRRHSVERHRRFLCVPPVLQQVMGLFIASAAGGYPSDWLFPDEPDANPAARSQRVPE